MRTIYIGTAQFAANVLQHLVDAGAAPQLVITRPDRPAGRGRKLTAPPVAELARELGINVAQPTEINDEESRSLISETQAELLLVCAYGAMIDEPLLSDYEVLNLHPSLLPRWRGAAPIERAIIAGDRQTGVSIMRLTEGLDSGPVCATRITPINDDDDFGSLSSRLEQIGGELLAELLDQPRVFTEQDDSLACYAEKISSVDRVLDPAVSAAERERIVRALSPHIGARALLEDGTMLGVRSARLSDGELIYDRVVPPGSREMSWQDFQRGHSE
jgi:methionyl-tRNA formyltransferase